MFEALPIIYTDSCHCMNFQTLNCFLGGWQAAPLRHSSFLNFSMIPLLNLLLYKATVLRSRVGTVNPQIRPNNILNKREKRKKHKQRLMLAPPPLP